MKRYREKVEEITKEGCKDTGRSLKRYIMKAIKIQEEG